MYSTLLIIHSTLRWLVILSGLAASVLALRWAASPPSTGGPASAPAAAMLYTIAFDVQVLVGLLLYLRFSPITTTAIHALRSAMSNDVMRFWAVEHPVGMLAGFTLAHVGRVKLRRAGSDRGRRRTAAALIALATLLVIVTTPWPFLPYGRPLL